MFETIQGIDIFFVVMAVSVAIATTIGTLIGWHVFGIAREVHTVARVVRDESEDVIHEAAVAAEEIVQEKVSEIRERIAKTPPKRRGPRKLVSG